MATNQLKIMPQEVADQLPRIERLQAYLLQGYAVVEEDADYFNAVCATYRIIYACETIEEARKKVSLLFPEGEMDYSELVNDTTTLFGDFFEINKTVMRRILERKFDYIYNRAIKLEDMVTANKALANIAKLYRLYDKEMQLPKLPPNLPEMSFSSDPEVFKEQKKYLDAASED